jgi:hypothetical protein
MFYVHKHEVSLQYGGPEEGGWHYTAGTPVEEWEVIAMPTEELAYEQCRILNDQERMRREAEEDYDFTSVLAHRSTHYSYSVEEDPIPRAFPATRPHYE